MHGKNLNGKIIQNFLNTFGTIQKYVEVTGQKRATESVQTFHYDNHKVQSQMPSYTAISIQIL